MPSFPTQRTFESPRVVILGGGFAGLAAVRELRDAPAEVVLLDRANHHTFQPLLYQVATAGLSAPQVAAPIRHILRRQENAHVMLGEAVAVDAPGKRVMLADGEVQTTSLPAALRTPTSAMTTGRTTHPA